MKFLKRQGAAFYLSVIVCIMTLIALILEALSSSVEGYQMKYLGLIVFSAVAVIVLLIAAIVCSDRLGPHHLSGVIAHIVSVILLCVAFSAVLLDRVILIFAQLSFDTVNMVGWGIVAQSMIGFALFLVASILLVIASFHRSRQEKEERKRAKAERKKAKAGKA